MNWKRLFVFLFCGLYYVLNYSDLNVDFDTGSKKQMMAIAYYPYPYLSSSAQR